MGIVAFNDTATTLPADGDLLGVQVVHFPFRSVSLVASDQVRFSESVTVIAETLVFFNGIEEIKDSEICACDMLELRV
jgi:hypothetical protein